MGGFFEKARLAKAQQAASQIKSLFLAQQASSEDNLFTAWYSFDGNGEVNNSNPYIIDKTESKNDLINHSSGSFAQDNETGIGRGKSIRIDNCSFASSALINGGAINKFTIAFWFKINDFPDHTYPVFFNSSAGFKFIPNNVIKFYINGASSIITPNNAFQENKWYYVVGSYDGDSIKMWLDGDLISEKDNVGISTSFSGKVLAIGYRSTNGYFDGWLDEVMFLPYAFDGTSLK